MSQEPKEISLAEWNAATSDRQTAWLVAGVQICEQDYPAYCRQQKEVFERMRATAEAAGIDTAVAMSAADEPDSTPLPTENRDEHLG